MSEGKVKTYVSSKPSLVVTVKAGEEMESVHFVGGCFSTAKTDEQAGIEACEMFRCGVIKLAPTKREGLVAAVVEAAALEKEAAEALAEAKEALAAFDKAEQKPVEQKPVEQKPS